MDDYQHFCPVCKSSGTTSFLHLRQINLTTAVYLCKDIRCSYPRGHTWMYVDRKFPKDNDSDSDLSDSSISDDIERLRIGKRQTAITNSHAKHPYKEYPRSVNIVRHKETGKPKLGILEETSKKDMLIVNSRTDMKNIIDDPDKILPVKNETDPIVSAFGVSDSEIVNVTGAQNTNESSNIEYKLVGNSESNEYKLDIQLIDQKQNNKEDIQRNVSECNLKKAFICNAVDLKTEKIINVNNKNKSRVETFKEKKKITVPDLSKVIIVSNKEVLSKCKTKDIFFKYLPYCKPNNTLNTKIASRETHQISVKKNLCDLEKNNIKLSDMSEKIQNTVKTDENIKINYENVPRLQIANSGDIPKNENKDVIKKNLPVFENEVEKVSDISEKIQNTVKTYKTIKVVYKDSHLQIVDSEDTLKNMNEVKNELPDLEKNNGKFSKNPGDELNNIQTDQPVEDYDEWSFIETSSATSTKKHIIKTPEKLKKDHFDLILPNVKDVQDMTIKIEKPRFDVIFKSKLKLQSKKNKRQAFKFSESMIDEALKITKEVETIEEPTENRSLLKSICNRVDIVGIRNTASRYEGYRYKSRTKPDRSTEVTSSQELRTQIQRSSVTDQTSAKEQSEEIVDSDYSNKSIVDVHLNVNDTSSKSAINDTTNLGLGDLTLNELFDNIDSLGPLNVPNNAVDIAEVDDWLNSLCQ